MELPYDGLLRLLLTLGPLLFLQPWLHREIQLLFILLTGRTDITVILFSILFLPGVLLHEFSHFIAAKILRVPTGKFSVIPADLGDGRLMLGFVEVDLSDPLRESLIGAAPLLAGSGFVAFAGLEKLGFDRLWQAFSGGGMAAFLDQLVAFPQQTDFWLWVYLTLAVSSTMMPSQSDRRAWLPVIVTVLSVAAAAFWSGAGSWLGQFVWPWLNQAMGAAAGIFGVAGALHIGLVLPVGLIRRGVGKAAGRRLTP